MLSSHSSLRFTSLLCLAVATTALSSVSVGAQSSYGVVGCYSDSGDQHTLTGKTLYHSALTREMCATFCDAYEYFGVEFGTQCFCGTQIMAVGQKRPDGECSQPCGGDPSEACGGSNRISIFKRASDKGNVSNMPKFSWFNYKSCWTDDVGARSLNGATYRSDDMTVQSCAAFCKQYRYFGVEYTNECYCGDVLGGQAAPEEQCGYVCAGNSQQFCGGGSRLSVYDRTCIRPSSSLAASSTLTSSTLATSGTSSTSTVTSSTSSSSLSSTSSTSSTSSADNASTTPSSTDSTSSSTTTTSSSEPLTSSTTSTTTSSETSSSSSSSDIVTTSSSESSTTSTTDSSIASTIPSTSSTAAPSSSTTTSSETSSTESSTSLSSTSVTTLITSTTQCALTTVYASTPSPCWISAPTACASLTRTPSIPWPAVTAAATNCRNGFIAGTSTAAAISACFTNVNSPQFNAASAYACVTNAPVYCQTTAVCAASLPAPTNAVSNSGFEAGDFTSWPVNRQSNGGSVITASVTTELAHSGSHSLKAVFDNSNGASITWTQDLTLEPGANYVASWWWYSTNSAASTTSRMQFTGATTFLKDAPTINQPTGVWTQVTQPFTATGGSYGRIYFTVYGNRANAANTFYVDDITIIKV